MMLTSSTTSSLSFTVIKKMENLAENLFFDRLKADLVGEPLNAIIELEKQFKENMDDFFLTEKNFYPRKCYRFEGTK